MGYNDWKDGENGIYKKGVGVKKFRFKDKRLL